MLLLLRRPILPPAIFAVYITILFQIIIIYTLEIYRHIGYIYIFTKLYCIPTYVLDKMSYNILPRFFGVQALLYIG